MPKDSHHDCEFCSALQQPTSTLEAEADSTYFTTITSVLRADPRHCTSLCRVLDSGIRALVPVRVRDKTQSLAVAGGPTSRSHFRIHGADDAYEDTFRIEFYTDRACNGWPWNLLLPGVPLPSRSDDLQCFRLIRDWLKVCRTTHELCRRYVPIPHCEVRMLHLQGQAVRLIDGFELHNDFAALSHCWGNAQHTTTTKATLEVHKASIDLAKLPKTFGDAITICEHLHIKFLWIDSLCIVQDDPDDWQQQAGLMQRVYTYAELVISADAASNSSEGLFRSRQQPIRVSSPSTPHLSTPVDIYVRDAIEHTHHTVAKSEGEEREPLSKRAWVLQEWLLARRVIHFSERELVWDCRQHIDCECGGFSRGHTRSKTESNATEDTRVLRGMMSKALVRPRQPSPTNQERIQLWKDVVDEYTARNLTKHSDRMIAIAGLASELGSSSKIGDYVCGFFEESLPIQLLWSRKDTSLAKARPISPVAPSWSWGSINEAVEWLEIWPDSSIDIRKCKIKNIADITIENDGHSQFDPTVQRCLALTANHIQGVIKKAAVLEFGQCLLTVSHPANQDDLEVFITPDVDLTGLVANTDLPVICAKLIVFESDANESEADSTQLELLCASLILLPVASPAKTYTRIGISQGEVPASWYDDAPRRMFTVM